jgi:predicted CoA-binding protein
MIDITEREQLLRIYAQTRTIAVVGASADAAKAAHQIPRYPQRQGYRIVPINSSTNTGWLTAARSNSSSEESAVTP